MLPVWLIVLLAIVEFGALLASQQQVALASRVGAEEASQTLNLGLYAVVPPNVVTVIEQQLNSSGISQCKVILENNVSSPAVLTSGACDCDPPSTPLPTSGRYVRVTVCVPITELVPNLLGAFGVDLSTCLVQHSTTFRYELSTP